jgi:glutamate---cysteine ligase / carboxylate-amine ligase
MTPHRAWAEWVPSTPYTLGCEEEVMVVDPDTWELDQDAERAFTEVPELLEGSLTAETHGSALELATVPGPNVAAVAANLRELRASLVAALNEHDLFAAAAGTHPCAVWSDTKISSGDRYQLVYRDMRELARREPTFALHVHVGVAEAEDGIRLFNRMLAHLPLLLAISANSPFWQGRDSGLASARTPIFQAFPRVGIPRAFGSYEEWVAAVRLLIECEAFSEPTFLWWDVRPQPRFGTIEIRVMDAQSSVTDTTAILALIQSIARLELEEGYASEGLLHSPEALIENRFIAARDGMEGRFLDPDHRSRVAVRGQLDDVIEHARPHAQDLGCLAELELAGELGRHPGAERQRRRAEDLGGLPALVGELAGEFTAGALDRRSTPGP